MDWGLAFVGVMVVAIWIPPFLKPEGNIRTVDGWRKRLNDLKNGEPESFFEERRQLEAYPPSNGASPKRLRIISALGIVSGMILLILAFIE